MSDLLETFELHPVRIPMRHRFRRVNHREAVLIRGPEGWGEFSPFPGYPPEVTTRWLAAALELACSALPAPVRNTVGVNVTVPVVAPETAAGLVLESGARTAKVKVGDPEEGEQSDRARVAAVREALGPEGRIRIDVNASWDVVTAQRRICELADLDLEYVEQPVATIDEMAELKSMIEVPLAADEVVRQSPEPLRVLERGAADILILKVQPMGGVQRVLELADRSSIPVVISSALETSVGMYGGLLAAACLPALQHDCGLGTIALTQGDPTPDPLLPKGGLLELRRPEPDPELLERWKPSRDRSAVMLRRVRSAAEILT